MVRKIDRVHIRRLKVREFLKEDPDFNSASDKVFKYLARWEPWRVEKYGYVLSLNEVLTLYKLWKSYHPEKVKEF